MPYDRWDKIERILELRRKLEMPGVVPGDHAGQDALLAELENLVASQNSPRASGAETSLTPPTGPSVQVPSQPKPPQAAPRSESADGTQISDQRDENHARLFCKHCGAAIASHLRSRKIDYCSKHHQPGATQFLHGDPQRDPRIRFPPRG